ncbi:hypothetical protein [Nocardioides sp. B-3]|uniref:hypothetical protein n=1 Tax=Nocardioides sp. B-3 TaxID=2895565 RepID=UPI002152E55C|nr:hypothetical protein [Nocardioides sp. B-3]UUZ58220.1 hypothetical protein LP418_18455 [Nocardioides sp. B-3]
MKRTLVWLAALPFATTFMLGVAVQPALADWAANCNNNGSQALGSWTGADARSYATTAAGDGYDWGGGCWNGNGWDDTPAENGFQNSVGEGPDCSGFTFKSWALALDGSANKRRWELMTNQHGPYVAASFKAGDWASMTIDKSYSTTMHMDVRFDQPHRHDLVRTVEREATRLLKPKTKAQGTNIYVRNYRSDGNYGGSRRENWG